MLGLGLRLILYCYIVYCCRRDDIISSIPLHSARLDHGGKEFYVTFLPYVTPNYEDVKLFITTPEQVSVTFTISAPGMGYTRTATVDPGRVKEVTFKGADYALRNTTDRSKGIIIKTENERQIFVYGAQQVSYSMDSFLALPPHDLGAKSYTYMAAMIHTRDGGRFVFGWKDIHALIGIVSVEDCTHLTITPTRNVTIGAKVVAAGDSINVTLHRAETLLIQCVGDLTGTKVTSNRPISFFCGDQCPYIPSGVPACDQIVEQLPPVEAWGNKFATVPLKTRRSFDVFRIVAASQGTTVNITCTLRNGDHGSVNTFHLNEGGFADVQVRSAHFCWVEADKRILLLQFAIGQAEDYVVSDPFMALVPAVSQYTNVFRLPMVRSHFSNYIINDFTHYLNIIIPAEHYQPDQIFLDCQSLQSLALEFVPIVHSGVTMAYAIQVEVNATTHTLMNGNSSGVIGMVAYGFAHGQSYGHTGGLQMPTHFSKFMCVAVFTLSCLTCSTTYLL